MRDLQCFGSKHSAHNWTTSCSCSGEDFSMAEVAKHTAKFGGDCWIVVEGVIHNTTSYIEEHSGGPQWISEVPRISYLSQCQDKNWLDRSLLDSVD